ncbi:MAG: ABC transporter ATP-binding protein [Acidimicrobiia bacterium]|nr:ABC transporter ATP-binding protein [Acidimicrobiia bacterium]
MIEAEFRLSRPDGFVLDVAFTVGDGETVSLLGPNGAGKSTVLACLAGLAEPDSGHIEIGGVVMFDADRFVPPEERRVGVVFQDLLLFEHMTVRENVAFGARDGNVAQWMDSFQLGPLADRRPSQLSGGESQRVALARTLAADPQVLLLDEPFSALDRSARHGLRRMLADHLRGFAGPRVVVTHDPDEAMLLADRILILEEGRITHDATPSELRLAPRTPYAAELVGTNHFRGMADAGSVDVSGHQVHIADRSLEGPVTLRIRPSAVAIARERPQGSPRNVWKTRIERIEPLGDRVRILTGDPLPIAAEVTAEARAALALQPGDEVHLSVKATEIDVEAD